MQKYNLELENESYFITPHQYEMFQKLNELETREVILNKKMTGTVGAVALDFQEILLQELLREEQVIAFQEE